MAVGFARYLFVPGDGPHYGSAVTSTLAEALRKAGLATGPDGDGLSWRPFRPDGALSRYGEALGLLHPTLKIEWSDEPEPLADNYLPPRGPWSRCPSCPKVIPSHGTMITHPTTGEDVLIAIEHCPSCGEPFDAAAWARADNRTIFQSRLVVALVGDSFSATLPTFAEGCPELVHTIQARLDHRLEEVFVAW